MLFICLRKERLFVKVNPKYLKSVTHSIDSPAKTKSGRLAEGRDENINNLLLEEFGTSPFIFKYAVMSLKSLSSLVNKPCKVN